MTCGFKLHISDQHGLIRGLLFVDQSVDVILQVSHCVWTMWIALSVHFEHGLRVERVFLAHFDDVDWLVAMSARHVLAAVASRGATVVTVRALEGLDQAVRVVDAHMLA